LSLFNGKMVAMPGFLDNERRQILTFWRLLELFSPQPMPRLFSLADGDGKEQVIEWVPSSPLPWDVLQTPENEQEETPKAWRHLVFLGVYRLKDTYEWLRRVSKEEPAHAGLPAGDGACVFLVLDENGRIIPGSAVLSAALWAIGRVAHGEDPGPGWIDEFASAQTRLDEMIGSFERARRASVEEELPPPQDADSLKELLRIVEKTWGIEGARELSMDRILLKSQLTDIPQGGEIAEPHFPGSPFQEELDIVIAALQEEGEVGAALRAYLTKDQELAETSRIDIVAEPEAVDALTSPERLPRGRWPRDPSHSPTLRQQFVINRALDDLAPTRGLLGINVTSGPGRTVVLRDILAGNVVERARRLAGLSHPTEAFTPEEHSWKDAKGFQRVMPQLRDEFCGFEMVVVAGSDAAAGEIAADLLSRESIGQPWRESADYFADIATAVLGEGAQDGSQEPPAEKPTQDGAAPSAAWGMVAARFGDANAREAFGAEFWLDTTDPDTGETTSVRMLGKLRNWRDGKASHRSWWMARHEFQQAEKKVTKLIQTRLDARQAMLTQRDLIERERILQDRTPVVEAELSAVESEMLANTEAERAAKQRVEDMTTQHYKTLAFKPGATEFLFTLGGSAREWRRQHDAATGNLQQAEQEYQRTIDQGEELRGRFEKLRMEQVEMAPELESIGAELDQLSREIRADKNRLGDNYPDEHWVGERRELHAPWLDAELEAARSELFLAALNLHEALLAGTAVRMVGALGTAIDVITGKAPEDLGLEKIRAAWQLFFLAVPVVTTGIELFGGMFGSLGPEAIGWAIADEAEQVAPQRALEIIHSAQRVIAIGDSTRFRVAAIPDKVLSSIAAACGVSATWIPPRASMQTLADRLARFGTTIDRGDERVWVSTPVTRETTDG